MNDGKGSFHEKASFILNPRPDWIESGDVNRSAIECVAKRSTSYVFEVCACILFKETFWRHSYLVVAHVARSSQKDRAAIMSCWILLR